MINLDNWREDNTLDNAHPNLNIGNKTRSGGEEEIVGLCRYCGGKTTYYRELDDGSKQPMCNLVCLALFKDIQRFAEQVRK